MDMKHVDASATTLFRISPRALLVSGLSLILAVVLAVSAAGVTYALLNSSATAGPAATVRSGTAALSVTTALSMPTTPMYPGLTVYGSAVLTNTGNVPLTVAVTRLSGPATSTAFSQALTIGFAPAASTTDCAAGRVTSPTTSTFAAPATGPVGPTLAIGAARIVCVAVTFPANAPATAQGQSASSFRLTVNGTQA